MRYDELLKEAESLLYAMRGRKVDSELAQSVATVAIAHVLLAREIRERDRITETARTMDDPQHVYRLNGGGEGE